MSYQIPKPKFKAHCVDKPLGFLKKVSTSYSLRGLAGLLGSFHKHEHWSPVYLQAPQK